MNDIDAEARTEDLVLEYDLDAPPEKVWRAISIPAFREKWLPGEDLAAAEPVSSAHGEEIRYRIRDGAPPFRESTVTLQVRPNAAGGSSLKIIHGPAEARGRPHTARAANDDLPCLMRAA